MSFDIDEKEFYETFAEITQDRGLEEAKRWAWSALDWTQQELRRERADSVAWLQRMARNARHWGGEENERAEIYDRLVDVFECGEHHRKEEG